MLKTNLDLRKVIKDSGIKLWQVAEMYGMSDANFSRKLRHELSQPDKEQIFSIIDSIIEEGEKKSGKK